MTEKETDKADADGKISEEEKVKLKVWHDDAEKMSKKERKRVFRKQHEDGGADPANIEKTRRKLGIGRIHPRRK